MGTGGQDADTCCKYCRYVKGTGLCWLVPLSLPMCMYGWLTWVGRRHICVS